MNREEKLLGRLNQAMIERFDQTLTEVLNDLYMHDCISTPNLTVEGIIRTLSATSIINEVTTPVVQKYRKEVSMNNTTQRLDEYWDAVRLRVCRKCIDGDRHGNCRLSGDEVCGLRMHFPKIVETVLSVKSDNMDPYVEALRRNVCAYCKHQSPDGTCMFRANLDCGLDRYFPLLVEAVEEVDERMRIALWPN